MKTKDCRLSSRITGIFFLDLSNSSLFANHGSAADNVLRMCLRVCACNHFLYTKYLQKLWTDFRETFWRGGAYLGEESIRFWWRFGLFRGSWIIFEDSLPLADWAQTDILLCISASKMNAFRWNFLLRWGVGPRTNRLDFGGDHDHDQDLEILCCPSRLISLSVKDISSFLFVPSIKPISQLRVDYDTTTTKKLTCSFLLAWNRVAWKQVRVIRRSRIVVVS